MFTKLEIRIEDTNNNKLEKLSWAGGENFKVSHHSNTFFKRIKKTQSEIAEIKAEIEQLVRRLL